MVALVALAFPGMAESQSLLGSRSSVDLMFQKAQQQELYFYQTATGVRRAAEKGTFVRLAGNGDYQLAGVSQPYVLPITRTFVERLAAQYRGACGERLVVTSAARPTSQRLANSVDRSVHPTGMAIDLRRPSSARCLSWLRATLLSLESRGLVEATEEKRPPHFHVAVYPRQYERYLHGGATAARDRVATSAPAPAPTRVAASGSAPDGASERYTVRKGDSIWSIARRSRVSMEEIKVANNLTSSRILAGQVIVIPR
jgi:hypothetical protein